MTLIIIVNIELEELKRSQIGIYYHEYITGGSSRQRLSKHLLYARTLTLATSSSDGKFWQAALTEEQAAAAVRVMPGSHDGKTERLCCTRDNVAEVMVAILNQPNTFGKSVTVIDGVMPVAEAVENI